LGDLTVESRQSVTFGHPNSGQKIRWENSDSQGLLGMVALWFEGDTAVVLTKPLYVSDAKRYQCPDPPYVLFRYENGAWTRKPLSDLRGKKIRSNTTAYPRNEEKKIRRSGRHLSATQTIDSYTYLEGVYKVPYVIDFTQPFFETTGDQNCDRRRTLLVIKEPK
jgi:hypothetical protein